MKTLIMLFTGMLFIVGTATSDDPAVSISAIVKTPIVL